MNNLLPSQTAVVPEAPAPSFLRDVLEGLGRPQKTLPCKYFYDAEGSRLFDRICELEEYYPTRCERSILERHAADMADLMGPGCMLIEYGSGSSDKTRLLLDQLRGPAAYVPVDISAGHLLRSARRLARRYPLLEVLPVCADFTRPFQLPESRSAGGRRIVFFSGSTIGNFGPPEAIGLLRDIVRLVGSGGGLLIGVDLKKERDILERAYNDAAGVTAAFNLNLLARINRELGGDFRLDRFHHHAHYDADQGRIEMHLISREAQTIHVGPAAFSFAAGESICTEYSYKYSLDDFRDLAAQAGLARERVWTDADRLYSVQYLRVRQS